MDKPIVRSRLKKEETEIAFIIHERGDITTDHADIKGIRKFKTMRRDSSLGSSWDGLSILHLSLPLTVPIKPAQNACIE